MTGGRVGTAVGASVGTEASVGGISVAGGRVVTVETRGGVAGGEQETMRRKKKEERRMRGVV